MKKIMRFKRQWLLLAMVCLMSFGAMSIAGCAGSTKTSTVTTQQTTNGVADSAGTTTVTTEKETGSHPRGVIGGLFYLIGQVLIWPFKAIGSLF